jgi:hypothetical protein
VEVSEDGALVRERQQQNQRQQQNRPPKRHARWA